MLVMVQGGVISTVLYWAVSCSLGRVCHVPSPPRVHPPPPCPSPPPGGEPSLGP